LETKRKKKRATNATGRVFQPCSKEKKKIVPGGGKRSWKADKGEIVEPLGETLVERENEEEENLNGKISLKKNCPPIWGKGLGGGPVS